MSCQCGSNYSCPGFQLHNQINIRKSAHFHKLIQTIALFSLLPWSTEKHHVFHTCQACYIEIRQIRHYLTHDALKTLICAFVLCRIDYCNSLLAGCPQNLICMLQKVTNNAARLISRSARSDHISPTIRALHWLPVESSI